MYNFITFYIFADDIEVIESTEDDDKVNKVTKISNKKRKLLNVKRKYYFDSDEETEISSKKSNKASKYKQEETESEDETNEDSDYEEGKTIINAFKRKKKKITKASSRAESTRAKKPNGKKDAWIDDEEGNECASSSAELESDDEAKYEVPDIDDDVILDFLNNYTPNDIQSLINISDLKLKYIVSMRPYIDMNDAVISLYQTLLIFFDYFQIVNIFEEIEIKRGLRRLPSIN